jgi:hypothetical protein
MVKVSFDMTGTSLENDRMISTGPKSERVFERDQF